MGVRDLIREEGVIGLWRGLGPCLISVVPQTTIYFTTYEQLKRSYIAWNPVIQELHEKHGKSFNFLPVVIIYYSSFGF
ncbi:unnamed protein product [Trichobilharzia regenti]|nr:unnamed protein product [Trichobilharzia regenti]